jgi:hypothetical protein
VVPGADGSWCFYSELHRMIVAQNDSCEMVWIVKLKWCCCLVVKDFVCGKWKGGRSG